MLNFTFDRKVQLLLTFALRVEIVFLPALNVTATVPVQPAARVTPEGRLILPFVVNVNGALVSVLGVVLDVTFEGLKRGTVTTRIAVAVCWLVSKAIAVSVVRPTSASVGL